MYFEGVLILLRCYWQFLQVSLFQLKSRPQLLLLFDYLFSDWFLRRICVLLRLLLYVWLYLLIYVKFSAQLVKRTFFLRNTSLYICEKHIQVLNALLKQILVNHLHFLRLSPFMKPSFCLLCRTLQIKNLPDEFFRVLDRDIDFVFIYDLRMFR